MEIKVGNIIQIGKEEFEILKLHNSFCWRIKNTFTKEIVNIFYANETHYTIIR